MDFQLERRNQVTRGGDECWRPVPRADLSLVRRFSDLPAGSIWMDLSNLLLAARGTLLDVGCRARPYRRLASGAVEYIGIGTVKAKEAFGYETEGERYQDGRTWPLADDSADLVVATETLEHCSDPQLFTREAAHVLRDGSTLIRTTPFAARWHFIPHDYWSFISSAFAQLIESSDFSAIRVYARRNATTVASYKCFARIAALLLPQIGATWSSRLLRVAGLPFVPLFLMISAGRNVSLRSRDGDDCLGHTVTAKKTPSSNTTSGSNNT